MKTIRLVRAGIAVISAAALILQSSPLSANTIAVVRQVGSEVRSAVLPASGAGSRTSSSPTALPLTLQTAPLVAPAAAAPLILPEPGVAGAGVPPPSPTGSGLPEPGVSGEGVPPPPPTGSGLPEPGVSGSYSPILPEPSLGASPRAGEGVPPLPQDVLPTLSPDLPTPVLPAAGVILSAGSGFLKEGALTPSGETAEKNTSSVESRIWRHALDRGFADASQGVEAVPEGAGGAFFPKLAPSSEHGSAKPSAPSGIDASAGTESAARAASSQIRRTFLGVLGSVVAAELWLETGAFVFPIIAQSLSGSFLSTAVMCASSVAALAVGSMLGGPAVDRFGIRKVYVAGLLVRSVGAAVLGTLYAAGSLSLPVLGALFAADYLLTGANRVAEGSTASALYGGDVQTVNRFGAWKQRVIEAVGVAGPFLIGQTIAAGGFGPALAVFAGVLGLGAFLGAMTVRPPPAAGPRGTVGIREAFAELTGKPALKWAAGLFGLSTALNLWLYLMVAPAFSLAAAPTASAAAGVMGWLTTLFSTGGFIGTWLSEKLTQRSLERAGAAASGPEARASFIRSTRVWGVLSALSFLGLWTFSLPGTLPALLAIVPIGIAFGGTLVQAETLIKLESPARLRGTILGLAAAAGFALAAAGFFPIGWLLDHFSTLSNGALRPSITAFHALGGLATSLSAASLWLSSRAPVATAIPEGQPGRSASGLDRAPAAETRTAPTLTSLALLSQHRPRDEILKEVKDICLEKKWDRWLPDIRAAIDNPRGHVLLSLDDADRVTGFQIITDRYFDDGKRVEVVLPGPFYAAYIATRADSKAKGAGKALFLAAARFMRDSGSDEMLAHIKKGSAAWGFFQSMTRYVPMKSAIEDDSYVVGETWMRTVFDVSRIAEEAP